MHLKRNLWIIYIIMMTTCGTLLASTSNEVKGFYLELGLPWGFRNTNDDLSNFRRGEKFQIENRASSEYWDSNFNWEELKKGIFDPEVKLLYFPKTKSINQSSPRLGLGVSISSAELEHNQNMTFSSLFDMYGFQNKKAKSSAIYSDTQTYNEAGVVNEMIKANAFGFRFGIGGMIPVSSVISLGIEFYARLVKFDDWTGERSESLEWESDRYGPGIWTDEFEGQWWTYNGKNLDGSG